MHQIVNARLYTTMHTGSTIIVLFHFVPLSLKHDCLSTIIIYFRCKERRTKIPLEQNVVVNSTRKVENASLIQN